MRYNNIFLIIGLIIGCYTVAYSQCGVNVTTDGGVYPVDDSIPCLQIGQSYNFNLFFRTWDTMKIGGERVDSFELIAINNLPQGLNWTTSNSTSNNRFYRGQSGCINLSGVTLDTICQYKIEFVFSRKNFAWIGGIPAMPYDSDYVSIYKYLRASNILGNCIAVDTNAADLIKCNNSIPFHLPNSPTGISSTGLNNSIIISPNPNNGRFTVRIDQISQQLHLELLNLQGQVLYNQQWGYATTVDHEYDFTNLAKGLYLLKISNENVVVVKRLLVE